MTNSYSLFLDVALIINAENEEEAKQKGRDEFIKALQNNTIDITIEESWPKIEREMEE